MNAMSLPDDLNPRSTPIRRGGLILCGGRSRRMGRPKAWLDFGGEPLLVRVARRLATALENQGLLVVVAAPYQNLPDLTADHLRLGGMEIRLVHDDRPDRGPLVGLAVGLAEAARRGIQRVYATSVDVPFLAADWVRFLFDRAEEEGGFDVVMPEAQGFRHPLAAVYCAASVAWAAERLIAADRMRPVFLLDQPDLRGRTIPEEELRRVDPALATLRNLNTPEDYERALADESAAGSVERAASADSADRDDSASVCETG